MRNEEVISLLIKIEAYLMNLCEDNEVMRREIYTYLDEIIKDMASKKDLSISEEALLKMNDQLETIADELIRMNKRNGI
jgi:hypothetical protein